MTDISTQLQEQVQTAIDSATPLSIHGSDSHAFMLPEYTEQSRLHLSAHQGIIDYQPTELNIRARAGTTLAEIRDELTRNNQRLATEIPEFTANATIGGALAMGLSGSSRPFHGALRDHVLGARLINGRGDIIDCGGQVMKNVAGYDISRLLAGSRGSLGPILDVTVKVLPQPETRQTLAFEMSKDQAIETMNRHAGKSLPLSAAAYWNGRLYLRLEGSASGVQQAHEALGGESLEESGMWAQFGNLSHEFFKASQHLWRVILPTSAPMLELESHPCELIDWCGGQRWITTQDIPATTLAQIKSYGGYAERWRGAAPSLPVEHMNTLQKTMHRRIKSAFDPKFIFNPALSRFD